MTNTNNTHPQKHASARVAHERQPVCPPELRAQHDPVADLLHPFLPKSLEEVDRVIHTLMPQPTEIGMESRDTSWAQELLSTLSTLAPTSAPIDATRLNELGTIQHWLRECLMEHTNDSGQSSGPSKQAFGEKVHAFATLSTAAAEKVAERTLQMQRFSLLLPSLLGLITALPADGVRITDVHVQEFEALGITIKPGTVTASEWFLLIVKAQRTLEQRWLHATTASHVVYLAMLRGQLFAQTADMLQDALLKIRARLEPDTSKSLPNELAPYQWIDQALSNPLNGVWGDELEATPVQYNMR